MVMPGEEYEELMEWLEVEEEEAALFPREDPDEEEEEL